MNPAELVNYRIPHTSQKIVPVYDGDILTKPSTDPAVTYELDGWTDTQGGEKLDPLPPVSGDTTYYAVYKEVPAKYTVTFANYNGARITAEQYVYGSTNVTYSGETPTRMADAQYSYEFRGWSKTQGGELGDITYYAIYEEIGRKYTITFMDDNNNVLATAEVGYGDTPAFEGTPERAYQENWHYVFDRWNTDFSPATGPATYYALFNKEAHNYEVASAPENFTCTDGGTIEYVCSCVKTKTEVKRPGPHTWGAWTVTTPATETETGLEERVCTVCDATEHRVIPATGSTPSGSGEGSDCPICGATHNRDIFDWVVGVFHQFIYLVKSFAARFAN